jgi:rubrerythrin
MVSEGMPLDQAWREAIDREREACDFYRKAIDSVQDASIKELFGFLLKEEQNHVRLLEDEFEKGFIQEM